MSESQINIANSSKVDDKWNHVQQRNIFFQIVRVDKDGKMIK